MSPCLAPGCVVRGQHTPPCDGQPTCVDHCRHWPGECPKPRNGRPGCDGHCPGCLPREADEGIAVCRWHANRFADAVALVPSLTAHLHEIGQPAAQATPMADETFSPGDPAERDALPAAWLAADEITSDLLGWVHLTCEETPRITWPNRKPWNGDVHRWALDHLPAMLAGEWAGDMVAWFVGLVETARHRWPTADDTQPVETLAMPCPRCEAKALIRKPPRYGGDPRRIECTDPDCSAIYTEDEYDRLVALTLRDGRMGKWRVEEGA